jgi:hypothetical protein
MTLSNVAPLPQMAGSSYIATYSAKSRKATASCSGLSASFFGTLQPPFDGARIDDAGTHRGLEIYRFVESLAERKARSVELDGSDRDDGSVRAASHRLEVYHQILLHRFGGLVEYSPVLWRSSGYRKQSGVGVFGALLVDVDHVIILVLSVDPSCWHRGWRTKVSRAWTQEWVDLAIAAPELNFLLASAPGHEGLAGADPGAGGPGDRGVPGGLPAGPSWSRAANLRAGFEVVGHSLRAVP